MVLEVIRYLISDRKEAQFEADYAQAAKILEASPFCLNYELARSQKEPNRYLLLIEWESAKAHLEGFRQSAAFKDFFALVKPYFQMLEEMEHYELTVVQGKNSSTK